MKFSYNWLRELVSGLDTPPAELMRLITLKTAECDGMEKVGAALDGASSPWSLWERATIVKQL